MTQPAEPRRCAICPPARSSRRTSSYRPTVFLGIGGLAAKTLQSLHRRLVDRFGDIRTLPALQMLLLDTDAETLKAVTEGDAQSPMPNEAAVLLPLRQLGRLPQ